VSGWNGLITGIYNVSMKDPTCVWLERVNYRNIQCVDERSYLCLVGTG